MTQKRPIDWPRSVASTTDRGRGGGIINVCFPAFLLLLLANTSSANTIYSIVPQTLYGSPQTSDWYYLTGTIETTGKTGQLEIKDVLDFDIHLRGEFPFNFTPENSSIYPPENDAVFLHEASGHLIVPEPTQNDGANYLSIISELYVVLWTGFRYEDVGYSDMHYGGQGFSASTPITATSPLTVAVPEPATLALALMGILLVCGATYPNLPRLRTPGVIAKELGEPLHRVLYVLRTRNHIIPTALAGRFRLYDRRAVAMVRHEIHAIDARRERAPLEISRGYLDSDHGKLAE